MTQPTLAAGLLVYRTLGEFQYLLLQASNNPGKNEWGPPKGHVDPGEDLMTTAKRETEEEAGMTQDVYEIDSNLEPFVLKYPVNNKPKEVHLWLTRMKSSEFIVKISNEHQDFLWVNADAAIKMTKPNLGNAIRKAEEYLRKTQNSN